MAKALKCDRCGILYEKQSKRDIFIVKNSHISSPLDLCSGCQSELENWLDDYKEEKEEATE